MISHSNFAGSLEFVPHVFAKDDVCHEHLIYLIQARTTSECCDLHCEPMAQPQQKRIGARAVA
jgi:hypothetical protein